MKVALLVGTFLLSSVNVASAFGNNNFSCTDWPEWTPMYWMQQMLGEDCDNVYGASYLPPYAGTNAYQSPYMSQYSGMPASPYAMPQTQLNPYYIQQQQALINASNPYLRNQAFNPYANQFPQWGNRSRFPNFSRNNVFPMVGNGFGSPMGMNPMGGSMMPMNMGMNPMGMGSPFGGGFGMPYGAPMSPMGVGMTPFSGNPFGGSSMNPFQRGGMMRTF